MADKLPDFSSIAAILGKRGGLKGGPARSKALSPKRRKEIARNAIAARWAKRTDMVETGKDLCPNCGMLHYNESRRLKCLGITERKKSKTQDRERVNLPPEIEAKLCPRCGRGHINYSERKRCWKAWADSVHNIVVDAHKGSGGQR